VNDEVLHHSLNDPALYSALTKIMRADTMQDTDKINKLPVNPVVAMAYVPLQFYQKEYDINEGFDNGTIFPELNKPFMPGDMR